MPCEMCLHVKEQQGKMFIDSEKMHSHSICSQELDKIIHERWKLSQLVCPKEWRATADKMCSAFKKPKGICWEQPTRKCRNGKDGLAPQNIPLQSWEDCKGLAGQCPDCTPAHFWACPAFEVITGMLGLPPWALLPPLWQRHVWCPHCIDAALAWTQPTMLWWLFPTRWPSFRIGSVPKSSYSKEPWDVSEAEKRQTATWSLHEGDGIVWAGDRVAGYAVNTGLRGPT